MSSDGPKYVAPPMPTMFSHLPNSTPSSSVSQSSLHNSVADSKNDKDVTAIERGVDWEGTELHRAAGSGRVDLCQSLVDGGAFVDVRDNHQRTPLILGAITGHLGVCCLMVDAGCNVNATDRDLCTALHWAARNGHSSIVRLLISLNANIMAENGDGDTPLHWASFRGQDAICEILLKAGSNVNAVTEDNETPLHHAAYKGNSTICVMLLANNADINSRSRGGLTPLHQAVWEGHDEVTKILIDAGADVNLANAENSTPLHLAAYQDQETITRMLLDAGADPKKQDWRGTRPIFHTQNDNIVSMLSDAGGSRTGLSDLADQQSEITKLAAEIGIPLDWESFLKISEERHLRVSNEIASARDQRDQIMSTVAAISSSVVSDKTHDSTNISDSTIISENGIDESISLDELQSLIKSQFSMTNKIDQILKVRSELKKTIVSSSKRSFVLDREATFIDRQLQLLYKRRITVDDFIKKVKIGNRTRQKNTLPPHCDLYARIFWLLKQTPVYLANLAKAASFDEIDNLLQWVMFNLYADQYNVQEENRLLSFFRIVLEDELRKIVDDDSRQQFLRHNTALTRILSAFCRRAPGLDALRRTLQIPLLHICDRHNVLLELDPIRVYNTLIDKKKIKSFITPEEAAQESQVKAVLRHRQQVLIETCQMFFDCITSTVNDMPYGIRWIAKLIHRRASTGAFDSQKINSMVGAFIFSRFFNPAIVSPSTVFIVECAISADITRNLVLVAKVLQNFSNDILFGEKETWLNPLNKFIIQNRSKLCDYINQLVDVPDLEDSLRMDAVIIEMMESIDSNMDVLSTNNDMKKNRMYIDLFEREIAQMCDIIEQKVTVMAPNPNDPLRTLVSKMIVLEASTKLDVHNDGMIRLRLLPPSFMDSGFATMHSECIYSSALRKQIAIVLNELPLVVRGTTLVEAIESHLIACDLRGDSKETRLMAGLLEVLKSLIASDVPISRPLSNNRSNEPLTQLLFDLRNDFTNVIPRLTRFATEVEGLVEVCEEVNKRMIRAEVAYGEKKKAAEILLQSSEKAASVTTVASIFL